MSKKKSNNFSQTGRSVVRIEKQAIASLEKRINKHFSTACELLLHCKGRIVVTGMGKSGHIGHKIAATLASTGSPAFFVHPGEASHGDLGMITRDDILLAISYSGNTEEILRILPLIKRLGIPFIALTGNPKSLLAKAADVHLDISVAQEACPLNLAPTTSTTVSLVMGDAIAIALLKAKGFTKEDFARSHPGGKLGKSLLFIKEIMHECQEIPKVTANVPLKKALLEMTKKSLGMTAIVDKKNNILGVFTDGDLRRTLDRGLDIHKVKISDAMTENPITVSPNLLAAEALQIMEKKKISSLLVVDQNKKLVGVLHFLDLLRAGIA